jgi:hypothetical protein
MTLGEQDTGEGLKSHLHRHHSTAGMQGLSNTGTKAGMQSGPKGLVPEWQKKHKSEKALQLIRAWCVVACR